MEAVAHLSAAWGEQLNQVDFAVEDVPDLRGPLGDPDRFDVDVVADASIPLGQVIDSSQSPSGRPLIVLFRRPLETRALDDDDLADLVLEVVVDRFAHVLGKDPDEIDPID